MLNHKLLEVLACPICKGDLRYEKDGQELICLEDALAFPIKDGIPIMLRDMAREITLSERERYQ